MTRPMRSGHKGGAGHKGRKDLGLASSQAGKVADFAPLPVQLGESLTAQLLEIGHPLALFDHAGHVLWSNAGYRDMEALLERHAELRPCLQPLSWLDPVELQRDGTASCEARVALETGPHHVTAHFFSVPDHDGQPAAIAGRIEMKPDMTRLVRDLTRLQGRFDDVVRLASDWIWECNTELGLTSLSERVFNVMGYHPRELVGRPLPDLALNRRARQTLLARFQNLSPFRDHVFEATDKAGQAKLLLISAVPIFDSETGRHLGFRGTASDITELTERERGLLAAKEAAEQANRAKTHFLAHMSHELRTPLNSIIGFSEMMRMQPHGPLGAREYVDYASDIHDSANRLLTVINDLLDITAIEAGNLVLNDTEVTLDMIVRPVLEGMRHKATAAGLTLEIEIPENLPHLFIDQRVMRQILSNLLSNAVKFTSAGGKVKLRAEVTPDKGMAISIIDTGIGIDEATMEHIFMPFFQVDTGTNRKFEGTGLGLALSKRLTELLGGQLSVTSKQHHGTVVSVILPAGRLLNPTT